ncbi:MAG: hypothetical protein H7334_12765 [Ferruginibacter sp.]|nr:hypothetical protein [Ferruginibacter sp.]
MHLNIGVAPKLRKRCRAIPFQTGSSGGALQSFFAAADKKRIFVAIPYASGSAVIFTGKANNPKGMEFVFIN